MKKNWKKVLSLLLAVAMVFTMDTTVFADTNSDNAATSEAASSTEAVKTAAATTVAATTEATTEAITAEADTEDVEAAGEDATAWTVSNDWAVAGAKVYASGNDICISGNSIEGDVILTAAADKKPKLSGKISVSGASASVNVIISGDGVTIASADHVSDNVAAVKLGAETVLGTAYSTTVRNVDDKTVGTLYAVKDATDVKPDLSANKIDFAGYKTYGIVDSNIATVSSNITNDITGFYGKTLILGNETVFAKYVVPKRNARPEKITAVVSTDSTISFTGAEGVKYSIDGKADPTVSGNIVSFNGLAAETSYSISGQTVTEGKFYSDKIEVAKVTTAKEPVAKKNPTVTLTVPESMTYGTDSFSSFKATVSPSEDTAVPTFKYSISSDMTDAKEFSSTAEIPAGTYYATAYVSANGNYNEGTSEAKEFKIAKASLTVSVLVNGSASAAVKTGDKVALSYNAASGSVSSITYYVDGTKQNAKTVSFDKAGTYTVSAAAVLAAGFDANYDVKYITATITVAVPVSAKKINVVASGEPLYYGQQISAKNVEVKNESGNVIKEATLTYSLKKDSGYSERLDTTSVSAGRVIYVSANYSGKASAKPAEIKVNKAIVEIKTSQVFYSKQGDKALQDMTKVSLNDIDFDVVKGDTKKPLAAECSVKYVALNKTVLTKVQNTPYYYKVTATTKNANFTIEAGTGEYYVFPVYTVSFRNKANGQPILVSANATDAKAKKATIPDQIISSNAAAEIAEYQSGKKTTVSEADFKGNSEVVLAKSVVDAYGNVLTLTWDSNEKYVTANTTYFAVVPTYFGKAGLEATVSANVGGVSYDGMKHIAALQTKTSANEAVYKQLSAKANVKGVSADLTLELKDNKGNLLVEGVDYKLTYKNNVNAWVAGDNTKKVPSVKIAFIGNYKGLASQTVYFSIAKANLSQYSDAFTMTKDCYTVGTKVSAMKANVTAAGKKLAQGKDFYVSIENKSSSDKTAKLETVSAAAVISIVGAGNYEGTYGNTETTNVYDAKTIGLLSKSVKMTLTASSYGYGTSASINSVKIVKGSNRGDITGKLSDYGIKVSQSPADTAAGKNAGYVTLTADGTKFAGSLTVKYTVKNAGKFTKANVKVSGDVAFTGKDLKDAVLATVSVDGVANADYYAELQKVNSAVLPGKYSIKVTGKNAYKGSSYTVTFTVAKAAIDKFKAAQRTNTLTVQYTKSGSKLEYAYDYGVSYNGVELDTALAGNLFKSQYTYAKNGLSDNTLALKPVGKYIDGKTSITIKFNITATSISNCNVEITAVSKNGTLKKAVTSYVVKDGSTTLKKGKDYEEVSPLTVSSDGKYYLTLKGKGGYSEQKSYSDAPLLGTIKSAACTVKSQKFSGSELTVSDNTLTVTASNGEKLKYNTDYTYTYSNNIYPGTAVITITGTGKYAGTKTVKFRITK